MVKVKDLMVTINAVAKDIAGEVVVQGEKLVVIAGNMGDAEVNVVKGN
jgi:hypothetical protein